MIDPYRPHFVFGIGDGSILSEIPENTRLELIIFPGEDTEVTLRPGMTVHTPPTLPDAKITLRRSFLRHAEIVTLSSAVILSDHPLSPEAEACRKAWGPELERRIAEFIEDLGNDPKDTWTGAVHALRHGRRLAAAPTTDDLLDAHANVPAICLGAGPSAEAELDRIAACQDQCIIFATDAMLAACKARGITPDYVCALERIPATLEMLSRTQTDGCTLLTPPVIAPEVVDLFGGRVVWYWRPDGLEKWLNPDLVGRNIGNSCGTQSVAAAIIAGCNPIYLVGHDLCCEIDGHTHAASAHPMTALPGNEGGYAREPATAADGRAVYTTPLWRDFHADIEYFLKEATALERTTVNVGRGLAIFGATQAEHLPEVLGPTIAKAVPTRKTPGRDVSALIDTIRIDCGSIDAACRTALEQWPNIPGEAVAIRNMVEPETALFWGEVTRALYSGLHFRLYFRPSVDEESRCRRRIALCLRGFARLVSASLDPARIETPSPQRPMTSPPKMNPVPSDWSYLRRKVEESDLWFAAHRLMLTGDVEELDALDEWQLDRLLCVTHRESDLAHLINRILKEKYGRTFESYGGVVAQARAAD